MLKPLIGSIDHSILIWEENTESKYWALEAKSQNETWTLALGYHHLPWVWEKPFPKSTLYLNQQLLGWLHHSVKQHIWTLLALGYWISKSLISYKKSCSLKIIIDYTQYKIQYSINLFKNTQYGFQMLTGPGHLWKFFHEEVKWWDKQCALVIRIVKTSIWHLYFHLALWVLLECFLKLWKVYCNSQFSPTISYVGTHVHMYCKLI